ncbi:uncharacterized protein [Palaemon carinicauda]|uniref:uncharacterized protein n=1 Tax=Palaemon carinicauda TaxID=392227 RepID=UPI0035B657A4
MMLTTTGDRAASTTRPEVSEEAKGETPIIPETIRSQTEPIRFQLLDETLKNYREAAYSAEAEIITLSKDNFLQKDGVLLRIALAPRDPAEALCQHVAVPRNFRFLVLRMAHEGLGGHSGVKRTTQLLQPHFFWPGLQKSVKASVTSCHLCQVAGNPNQVVPRAPLQPIPSAGIPFPVLVEYVGSLTQTKRGNHFQLTMIDRFTRCLEAVTIRCASAYHAIHEFPLPFLTDHNPLTYLAELHNKNKGLMRWGIDLQNYNWKVKRLKGSDERVADVFSQH